MNETTFIAISNLSMLIDNILLVAIVRRMPMPAGESRMMKTLNIVLIVMVALIAIDKRNPLWQFGIVFYTIICYERILRNNKVGLMSRILINGWVKSITRVAIACVLLVSLFRVQILRSYERGWMESESIKWSKYGLIFEEIELIPWRRILNQIKVRPD